MLLMKPVKQDKLEIHRTKAIIIINTIMMCTHKPLRRLLESDWVVPRTEIHEV